MSAAAILACGPQPLGIPPVFIADLLGHGYTAASSVSGRLSLFQEYSGARGYTFEWGQVMEQQIGDYLVWRIVPVQIWERLAKQAQQLGARSPMLIADWIELLHPGVRKHVPPQPLPGLTLAGCSGGGQRCPHTLLAWLCTAPDAERSRTWFAETFMDQTLPLLLDACAARLPVLSSRHLSSGTNQIDDMPHL